MLALQPSGNYVSHPEVQLVPSKMFKVLERTETDDIEHRTANSYKLDGYLTNKNPAFLKNMRLHGLCTWVGLVSSDNKNNAFNKLRPVVKKLIASYDEVDDEFSNIDQDEMNIVRMPRIGRGKHNVHFDPLESPQHAALEKLAAESHFSELLSKYMGAHCTLRESGISITRPYNPSRIFSNNNDTDNNGENADTKAGEGMEWHSDGPKGESTILMALEDVAPEQGSLMVIPGSHRIYVDGVGHTEVSCAFVQCFAAVDCCDLLCLFDIFYLTGISQGAPGPTDRRADRIQLPRGPTDDHRRAHSALGDAQRVGQVASRGVVHLR